MAPRLGAGFLRLHLAQGHTCDVSLNSVLNGKRASDAFQDVALDRNNGQSGEGSDNVTEVLSCAPSRVATRKSHGNVEAYNKDNVTNQPSCRSFSSACNHEFEEFQGATLWHMPPSRRSSSQRCCNEQYFDSALHSCRGLTPQQYLNHRKSYIPEGQVRIIVVSFACGAT